MVKDSLRFMMDTPETLQLTGADPICTMYVIINFLRTVWCTDIDYIFTLQKYKYIFVSIVIVTNYPVLPVVSCFFIWPAIHLTVDARYYQGTWQSFLKSPYLNFWVWPSPGPMSLWHMTMAFVPVAQLWLPLFEQKPTTVRLSRYAIICTSNFFHVDAVSYHVSIWLFFTIQCHSVCSIRPMLAMRVQYCGKLIYTVCISYMMDF
jgi:hypothetical protein